MPRRFDLVIFDLGGVLVKAVRSSVEAHERAGLPFPPPSGPEFEARRAALPRQGNGTVHSAQYFTLFADASQGVYTAADVRRISDASVGEEHPGISRVFDALEAVDIDTAVLSNTNDAHWARLFPETPDQRESPTLVRARHRFASHLLGVEKPDPRAYRHVEHATRHPADRILFFDDLPDNVEGARGVGWTAELIDYTGDTAVQMLASLRRRGVVELLSASRADSRFTM